MSLRVELAEGASGCADPHVIWFGSRRLAVEAVEDRWYGAHQRWWKVKTADGLYVLRLDEASGAWDVAAVVRE